MNDKLREALVIANALQNAITDELAASKQKPTTCGHCTYEESDGSLIEQCQACKDKDSKQEPMRLADVHGVVCGGPSSKQEPQAQAEPDWRLFQFQTPDGDWHNFVNERHYEATVRHGDWPIRELITLQSHREAMAAALVEMASVSAKAIAKKDAALKEIVSKGSQMGYGKMALVLIAKAAIAQAREARK